MGARRNALSESTSHVAHKHYNQILPKSMSLPRKLLLPGAQGRHTQCKYFFAFVLTKHQGLARSVSFQVVVSRHWMYARSMSFKSSP